MIEGLKLLVFLQFDDADAEAPLSEVRVRSAVEASVRLCSGCGVSVVSAHMARGPHLPLHQVRHLQKDLFPLSHYFHLGGAHHTTQAEWSDQIRQFEASKSAVFLKRTPVTTLFIALYLLFNCDSVMQCICCS